MDSFAKTLIARMTCFVAGDLLFGLICSWATVFVFHSVDKKFSEVPMIAFRFELVGLAFQILIGWALFTTGLVVLGILRGWSLTSNPIKAFLYGAAFSVSLGVSRWIFAPKFLEIILFLLPIAAAVALTNRSTRTQPLPSTRPQ